MWHYGICRSTQARLQCHIEEEVRAPGPLKFTHIKSGVGSGRYTDFLVNEILPSGAVVHLTDLKAPGKKDAKQSLHSPTKPANRAGQAPGGPATAPEPTEPSSDQTEDKHRRPLVEPEPVKRHMHRVLVKQTDEGIEEINKEDGSSGHRQAAAKENLVPPEPIEVDSKEAEKPIHSPPKLHVPSTANDWQAYAGKQMDKAKGSEVCLNAM